MSDYSLVSMVLCDHAEKMIDTAHAERAGEAVYYLVTLDSTFHRLYVKTDLEGLILTRKVGFSGLNIRLWVPHCSLKTWFVWMYAKGGGSYYRYQVPRSLFNRSPYTRPSRQWIASHLETHLDVL